MRAVVLAFALLAWPVAAGAEHAPPERSPVRVLWRPNGRCSAVAMSPTTALTAAHCLAPEMYVNGRAVSGARTDEDLARLTGKFDPPYARLAGPIARSAVLLEGFGCDPKRVVWLDVPVRRVRAGLLIPASGGPGLELVVSGRACPGDSGGALWADRGNLIGILTATAAQEPYVGKVAFATHARL